MFSLISHQLHKIKTNWSCSESYWKDNWKKYKSYHLCWWNAIYIHAWCWNNWCYPCLKPRWTSKMECFCENSRLFLFVNYFRKKAPCASSYTNDTSTKRKIPSKSRNLYLPFVDLEKAFDDIPRWSSGDQWELLSITMKCMFKRCWRKLSPLGSSGKYWFSCVQRKVP